MNQLAIMAELEGGGDLKRPLYHLSDIKFLTLTLFLIDSFSKIAIGAVFHHQVIKVAVHLIIEISERKSELQKFTLILQVFEVVEKNLTIEP